MKITLLQGAIINAIINAAINGAIQWFSFKKYEKVPISVDSISNQEFTVPGNAVQLSVAVSPLAGTLLVGLIAGIVAGVVNHLCPGALLGGRSLGGKPSPFLKLDMQTALAF